MLDTIMKKFFIDVEEKDIGHVPMVWKMFRKPLPSIQERKKIEANLVDKSDLVDLTHLNVYDFFKDT